MLINNVEFHFIHLYYILLGPVAMQVNHSPNESSLLNGYDVYLLVQHFISSFGATQSLKSPSISHYSGTDSEPREDGEIKSRSAEKRQSSEGTEEASAAKKISLSLGPKPAAGLNQKISFNLGGATKAKTPLPAAKPDQLKQSVMPIKMSLGSSLQVTNGIKY